MTLNEIMRKWADDNDVRTVNRSYGEYTTGPVSVEALENLVRSAMIAEREACAKVCDRHASSNWNDDRKAQAKLDASDIRARTI